MTPAEELRAAAKTLREAYAALVGYEDIRGRMDLAEVNAWIRTVHPGVAEPFADLLDLMADAMDNADAEELIYTRPDSGESWSEVAPGVGIDRDIRSDWSAVLRVARAINGGAS